MRFTYRGATTNSFAAAAGADAFFVISGSASRTRFVRSIRVSGLHLTTLAVITIVAEKWGTAAFTGGTATELTRVPVDSAFSAAATDGLVQVYTVAPTEGTLVGTVASRRVMLKSTTVVDGAPFPDVLFEFSNDRADERDVNPRGIKLHGLLQSLSLAFGAAPASAVTLSLEVEWDEEAGP